jgi:glucose-1-phosphate thymidylyltransferase
MELGDRINGSIIIQPCYLDRESRIESSIIGPYVSVAKGCEIKNAIISNSILNEGSSLTDVMLEGSVVGAYAEVTGRRSSFNVSDHSQIDYR